MLPVHGDREQPIKIPLSNERGSIKAGEKGRKVDVNK